MSDPLCNPNAVTKAELLDLLCLDLREISPDPSQTRLIQAIQTIYGDLGGQGGCPSDGVVNVSIAGDDSTADGSCSFPFRTIKAALESITDNDQDHRYVVKVFPGIYLEDNPIQMKSYVSVTAYDMSLVTRVECENPTESLFVVANQSSLENMTLSSTTTGAAIDMSVPGNFIAQNISFRNCDLGLHLNHPGANVTLRSLSSVHTPLSPGDDDVYVEAGNLVIDDYRLGIGGAQRLFRLSGVNSIVTLRGVLAFSAEVTQGILIENGARVVADGINLVGVNDGIVMSGGSRLVLRSSSIFNCIQEGLRIEDVGSNTNVEASGVTIEDSGRLDLNILSPTARVYGLGSFILNRSYLHPDAFFCGAFIDLFEGDEAFKVSRELHAGTPQRGAESCLGEGDSFTFGMLVYTDDGAGTQVDVSEEAASASGSTFSFPGVGAGNLIYIGCDLETASDYYQFWGIKELIETAAVLDGGDIVFEYWNGSSWARMNWMTTEGSAPYYPLAEHRFVDTGSFQVRFNQRISDWTKNNPITALSGDRFWIRLRIDVDITTAPVFQQFKLHANRMEVNSDGWPEYFGKARPLGKLDWSVRGFQPAGTNLSDFDNYYSDTLDIGMDENGFDATGDRSGFNTTAPDDMDTSTPVELKFAIRVVDAGTLNYTIRWTWAEPTSVNPTSKLYPNAAQAPATHINQQSISGSIVANAVNDIIWITEYLDFSGALPRRQGSDPDLLVCTIEKDSADVDFAAIDCKASYLKWGEGGHID